MVNLLLVRHGQSVFNQEKRVQGHLDTGLSPLGHTQAQLLAARLVQSGLKPAAIYTSSLRRARETASYLERGFPLPLIEKAGLMEMGLGCWEGEKLEDIKKSHELLLSSWLSDPSTTVIEGAEDFSCFLNRVRETFQEILQIHADEGREIIIVAHGGVLGTFICHSLGIPYKNLWCLKIDNASISRLVFYKERAYLTCLNDVTHLNGKIN